ncbi:hypothetical protein [Acidianus ambivalens]|uniref:Uncharacterized protein n=1 Tax=Acidianus ambivalens TaxID=2283 RepID=A0A6G1T6G4_ACIAM|nr:hypothetical protein [Acidianus ambivalens]MQL56593.1 hypothetical protein [Acidianus ambivalens]
MDKFVKILDKINYLEVKFTYNGCFIEVDDKTYLNFAIDFVEKYNPAFFSIKYGRVKVLLGSTEIETNVDFLNMLDEIVQKIKNARNFYLEIESYGEREKKIIQKVVNSVKGKQILTYLGIFQNYVEVGTSKLPVTSEPPRLVSGVGFEEVVKLSQNVKFYNCEDVEVIEDAYGEIDCEEISPSVFKGIPISYAHAGKEGVKIISQAKTLVVSPTRLLNEEALAKFKELPPYFMRTVIVDPSRNLKEIFEKMEEMDTGKPTETYVYKDRIYIYSSNDKKQLTPNKVKIA